MLKLKGCVVAFLCLLAVPLMALGSQKFSLEMVEDVKTEVLRIKNKIEEYEPQAMMTRAFYEYEAEYKQVIKQNNLVVETEVASKIKASDVFLFSDLHGHQSFQKQAFSYLSIFFVKGAENILVLEWIDKKFERQLNQFLEAIISVAEFRRIIEESRTWDFQLESYIELLIEAHRLGYKFLLTEDESLNLSLNQRDQKITNDVVDVFQKNKKARFFIFYGALHLMGEGHLYELFAENKLRTVLLTGVADKLYWKAVSKEKSFEPKAVYRFAKDKFYYSTESPQSRESSHLKSLVRIFGSLEDQWEDELD